MSVVCDRRPMPDPLAACGGGVRQGKRKEVEREEEEETSRPGFYIDDVAEEENGSDQSSIGVASNDCSSSSFGGGGGDEEDEVESKPAFKDALLGSFDSLEESLPIKRGLSNFFSGKSKSFTTLPSVANSSSSSVASAADLAKKENPFNKRRRVLMAACNRRASCGSFVAHLPPLLSPQRETEEKDGDATDDDSDEEKPTALMVGLSRKGRNGLMMNRSLAAPRSYSLSDLQQHV